MALNLHILNTRLARNIYFWVIMVLFILALNDSFANRPSRASSASVGECAGDFGTVTLTLAETEVSEALVPKTVRHAVGKDGDPSFQGLLQPDKCCAFIPQGE